VHQLFADVMTATLRALSRVPVETIDNSALDLIFLVKEIYARIGAWSPLPRRILSSINGVDPSDLKLLDDTLASPTGVPLSENKNLSPFAAAIAQSVVTSLNNSDAKTAAAASGAAERKYRLAFKTFLTKYVIGVALTGTAAAQSGGGADKSTRIVNLPEALVLSRQKLAKQTPTGFALDDTSSHALMSLFK
jgi:hypothetical protein